MSTLMELDPEEEKKKQNWRPDCFAQVFETESQAGGAGSRKSAELFGTETAGRLYDRRLANTIELEANRRRLLVAVRNDDVGNWFLDRLRLENDEFRFAGTLGEMLVDRGVENALLADELKDKFAVLEVLPGREFQASGSVFRHGCVAASRFNVPFPNIDIEPAQRLQFSRTGLGPNYELRSAGSMHDEYLRMLKTSDSKFKGQGVVIAVVDSGFEKPGVLSGFVDLVEPNNRDEKDVFGHGTAMASIIKDTAPGAALHVVRMADEGPDVAEAMLGISAGLFHCKADIINLSFGLEEGVPCSRCGAQGASPVVFQRFLHAISQKQMSSLGSPILVAATGNEGRDNGFDLPAKMNFVLAVGSINSNYIRSRFSNFGTNFHGRYIMMPGGESQDGDVAEWIGEANYKCYGTSAAAAYASGVLALYMSDANYQAADRDNFLIEVLNNCHPCFNHDPDEHGEGYLAYRPRP